ncbi:MAG: TIGR04255 family protein [Hyphomicrobiales bacterium]|nr:TIGR04255 family protein [Hyphomicrobiales bacterium]MDE2115180.1 TIGR04255 family protein [Hyphomicrobiales bacterium]
MTHLPNAPLIFTLGLVRFPTVPNMDRFVPAFHDALRDEMPHLDPLKLNQMQVQFGPEGLKVNNDELQVWQIASPDRKFAFVLTPDSLVLHTNSYREHHQFIEMFKSALTKLIAVPEIGINWVTSIAMRYIDLIVPRDGEKLNDLLDSSVLPPAFSGVANLEIVEGLYVAQYRTTNANVRFQILRNPQAVLPPDVNTPLIQKNNWAWPRPDNEFAVVDTDCSTPLDGTIALDVPIICDHMKELRFVAKSIFEHIGTEGAKKRWEGIAS